MNKQSILILGILIGISIIPIGYAMTETQMIIDMVASQSANPFEIKDSVGTTLFAVDTNGDIVYTRTFYESTPFTTETDATGHSGRKDVSHLFFGEYMTQPNSAVTTFSEPGAGVYQWTRTITADDLPTGTLDGFKYISYFPMISYQFENTDSVSRTLNIALYVNGVQAYPTQSTSAVAGNFFTGIRGDPFDTLAPNNLWWDEVWKVGVGDTVQIKYWITTSDTTNPVVLKRMALWVQPAVIEVTAESIINYISENYWEVNNQYRYLYPDIDGFTVAPDPIIDQGAGLRLHAPNSNDFFFDNDIQVIDKGTQILLGGSNDNLLSTSDQRGYIPLVGLGEYVIID